MNIKSITLCALGLIFGAFSTPASGQCMYEVVLVDMPEVFVVEGETCPFVIQNPTYINVHVANNRGEMAGYVALVAQGPCRSPQTVLFHWSPTDGFRFIPLPGGHDHVYVRSMNDHGLIAVLLDGFFPVSEGALYHDGQWQLLKDDPRTSQTPRLDSLNNHGVGAGILGGNPSFEPIAIRWSSETGAQSIHPKAGGSSFAFDINDAGTIVGGYFLGDAESGFTDGAFILHSSGEQQLLPPTFEEEHFQLSCVNDAGTALGTHALHQHIADSSFLFQNGEIIYLPNGDPPWPTFAVDLNNLGQALGYSDCRAECEQGVLWQHGKARLASEFVLPSPHFDGFDDLLRCINDRGEIFIHNPPLRVLRPVAVPPGDVNIDCRVDGEDLGMLLVRWGQQTHIADLNDDGLVNGVDLGILLASWSFN